MIPRRRWRWLACLAAAAAAVPACTGTRDPGATPDARAEVARQQQVNARLQRVLELARGSSFYLVFDPAASDLSLMLSGAELRRYPVLGANVGRPRVAWWTRQEERPWQDTVWTGGTLEPPRQIDRLVVEGPEPGQPDQNEPPAPPPIPPTAEELYPVPARYLIRFAGGLSVEIRPREADAGLGRWGRFRLWWGTKWRDVVAATFRRDRDAVRLRLILKPEDAEALYRALPPDVRLLVL